MNPAMSKSFIVILVVLTVFITSGCAVSLRTGRTASSRLGAGSNEASIRHEGLNGTLWTQTSVEYEGVTRSIYSLATLRLEQALSDSMWTASLEQLDSRGYSSLPPAVILDVDETVLDNSAFQARLIEDDSTYNQAIWRRWVLEEKATPVPGALEFTRYADSRGVKVFYLTNRHSSLEKATLNNLIAMGFPVDPYGDTIFTRGEIEAWRPSDKTPRREFIANDYRILLLIGDNYGDFTGASSGSLEERARSAEGFAPYWGKKWIVLPNAQYGSWEGALFDYRYRLSEVEKLDMKYKRLRTYR